MDFYDYLIDFVDFITQTKFKKKLYQIINWIQIPQLGIQLVSVNW